MQQEEQQVLGSMVASSFKIRFLRLRSGSLITIRGLGLQRWKRHLIPWGDVDPEEPTTSQPILGQMACYTLGILTVWFKTRAGFVCAF